jgi:hypothetical protein
MPISKGTTNVILSSLVFLSCLSNSIIVDVFKFLILSKEVYSDIILLIVLLLVNSLFIISIPNKTASP